MFICRDVVEMGQEGKLCGRGQNETEKSKYAFGIGKFGMWVRMLGRTRYSE